MVSPSNEDRICAMFDSFSKTTSRNYFKDLLRAEKRRDKNYQEEPVEYILELLSREDTYPSDFFVHCIIKCNKRYLKTLVAFIFLPEYPLFKRLSRDWRDAVGETEIQKIIV